MHKTVVRLPGKCVADVRDGAYHNNCFFHVRQCGAQQNSSEPIKNSSFLGSVVETTVNFTSSKQRRGTLTEVSIAAITTKA